MSDYTIDWSHTNVDGNNTLTGPDGDITVSVATPKNGEGKQWFVENGMLKNWDVTHDSSADITFSQEVTNISFTLLDVDRLDEITIMTKDADGNPVPVEFEATGVHHVNGNVVTGTQTTADGPSATNSQQDIDITIEGPLKTFWIVLDDGPERSYSGTVAVSDIHFDIAAVLDGTVEGTDGDDVIDVAYTGDPDGDMVDNNDAILAGDSGDDDLILGFDGNDEIVAGNGDDEVYGGSGDDSIEGNAGDDVIYGDNGDTLSFHGTQDFNDLSAGDLVEGQYVSDGLTITSANAHNPVMVFDTSNPTGGDHDLATGNLGNVLILSEDGDSNDPDDNYHGGTFNITFDSPAEVSSLTLLDVEEGAWIKYYDANGHLLEQVDVYTYNNGQCVVDTVVQNVSSMEVILGGSGAIDNLSYSLSGTGDAGNDVIDGGDGADVIFGEGGDDKLDGGAGDDVIYGDTGDGASASTVRETLDWALQTEHEVDTTFVQDTGNVDVTFTRTVDANHHDSFLTHEAVNVDGLDGVDSTGGLRSETNGQGGKGEFQWEFSEPVTNVEFNINDIDGDGVVEVRAFDVDGNEIPVTLEGGNNLTLLDTDGDSVAETADSQGGYEGTTSPNYNLQVTVAGPVASIVVEHTQDGANNSGIVFTDMAFDAVEGGVGSQGGDDVITGGAGADEMFGEEGNDTFIVSSAADGAGDVIDGGNGPDETTDFDVLDLTGAGNVDINDAADANDTGATAGTVTFEDGSTLAFEGIEQIITDPQNEAPTANDDTVDVDEDGNVTFDPTTNDNDPDGDDLTVVDITDPANGTLVDNGDGTYTYVPDENFNGTDTVTYTVQDPSGEQSTATVTFNVAPVNDDPVAGDDTAETDEDTPVTIDVLNNDTDVDGDDLTVTEATSPDGTVDINPDGTVTFTPDENFNGDTTITYTVDDGQGGTDTATVAVTVNAIDELEAVDDTAETEEDTPVTIDVVANDLNEDGGEPTIIDATVPADQGTVEIVGNQLVFTPAENFNGDATITYTIEDEDGLQDTADVAVTVTPVNDGPDAVNDTDTTEEDTPITVDLLANDSDVDGDDLTVTGATVPADQGTLVDNGDGTVTFTPAENFNGTATISYAITDGNGGTDTAIHEIDVTPVNDDPVAVGDAADTMEEEPVVVDLIGNDTDVDGDDLTIGEVSVPAEQGTVVDNGDGTVTFTPAENFTGPATITYTVVDGNGGEDTGEATVNVGNVIDAPDAVDDQDTTEEDTAVTVDLLANDSDPEGQDLTVTGASVPAEQGTLVDNGDGTVTFTPAPDFNGTATISYSITDTEGGTDSAIHEIIVTPVNDDPVAVDDLATTDEDEPVIIDLIGNDTDVDGDDLTIGEVTVDPALGTVEDNGDGTVTFTPAPDYNGPVDITYTVVDGQGGEDEGQVTVSVGAVNDDPVANDDTDTTEEDTPVTVDLLGNDTDTDGDDLTVISATVPAEQGTLEDNGDGTVTFTPAPDFNGTATISYEVSDGNGGTDTAIHEIEVTPVGDAPVTEDDVAETDEDTPVTIDVLGNDEDPDGQPLTIGEASVPADQGTVEIVDGELVFTPAPDFNGEATITYTAEDPDGNETPGTVTVTVNPVNDDPVAEDDAAETPEDTPVVIDLIGNDTDVDGDDLTIGEVSVPAEQGEVVDNGDGTVNFTPAENFNGEATITYTVVDGNGGEDEGTATVTVTPVNDAPEANDDADVTAFNTPVTVDLLGNDTDVDGDDLSVVEATVPASQGTLVDNGDGTVTFTPATGFVGTATISYTIEDEEGLQDSAIHTIDVQAGVLDGTVEGTDGDDLIDGGYMGDPEGDRVDNNDAILPGDVEDDDLILGFGGDDTILAGQGDDEVFGGEGNDSILGQGGFDTLSGDDGNDTITGGRDDDTIFGGQDDDVLDGDSGNDSIQGNEGEDSILGGGGDDIIRGGTGNDTIDGGNNNDMIFGGADDDVLDGGSGDDKIEGGSGDDTLIGGQGDDDLWGASGDDSIDGGTGNDTITSGDGNDVVDGGDGDDIIDTSGHAPLPDLSYGDLIPPDGVTIPLLGGGTLVTSPTDDLDTVFGGAGNDTITTGDDADSIDGGTGDDFIDGGIDADNIDGGDGNDTIVGGEGSDTIKGGDGDDTIFAGILPGETVLPAIPGAPFIPEQIDDDLGDPEPDNGDDLVFGGAGNDTIFGADDSDELYGDEGDDVLNGEIDDDSLFGGEGEDVLTGGEGADVQEGGLGNDLFIVDQEGDGAGDVIVGGEDPDLDGDGESDDVDVLDLTGSGVATINYQGGDPSSEAGTVVFNDGTTLTFSEIENVIPCFTPGTTIATPKGERLVEELREGDRIITRDNGIQEIRWVGRKEMSGKALMANPHLKPILVRAGSLGNGLPERDMLVSPNHRMLVASEKTQLYFEEREVLAAAKHLVGSDGIHEVDVMGTAYIHFMFDRHEVVLSNGAWTESFQPGDYTLKGIGNAQRNEILELFPELATQTGLEGYQSARRALKKHEAKLLVK